MVGDSFDVSQLLGEFREEAAGQLDVLDEALFEAERTGALDEATAEGVQRALHTLKGNAGMLGLRAVRDAVHGLESIFRDPPEQWTRSRVDRLLDEAGRLRRAIEAAGTDAQAAAFAALEETDRESDGAVEDAGRDTEEAPATPKQPQPGGEAEPAARRADGATERVRIPFRRLDELLNQSGRLAGLSLALDDLLRQHRSELRRVGIWHEVEDYSERLGRLVHEMRRSVMDLRLVPISTSFSRYPRVARDLAREQGKRVRVELQGERTELDKSTVDQVAEPLLHLVRNAIDHGIEAPEEREARGKPPEGRLLLAASQVGERVRIVVEDDGRGLDMEAIVQRARARGVIGPDEEPGSPVRLIFRPGFSTAERESTVSGRGVGLDVVRRQVQALRGEVRVEQPESGGTRFVLNLPLTVAVTSAVLFEESGELLALPAAVVETTIRADAIERVGAADVIRRNGETIPVARPGRLFGWERGRGAGTARFAMVVRRAGGPLAITADRMLDQREVLVKHLPPFLGRPSGVTGVTVTAAGRAVFLLDPDALLDLSVETQRHGA